MAARLTYRQYEQRRLGTTAGEWQGIKVMFRRSFGAASFGEFWRYWNPLFSYYLYYRCYRPLVRLMPRPVAVVTTFFGRGGIHDLAASLARWELYFLFAPTFAIFGLLVVAEEGFGIQLARFPRWLRGLIYAAIITGTFAAGYLLLQ